MAACFNGGVRMASPSHTMQTACKSCCYMAGCAKAPRAKCPGHHVAGCIAWPTLTADVIPQLLEYAEGGDAGGGHKQDYFVELWDVGASMHSCCHFLVHSVLRSTESAQLKCTVADAASQELTSGTGRCAAYSTSRSTASSSSHELTRPRSTASAPCMVHGAKRPVLRDYCRQRRGL